MPNQIVNTSGQNFLYAQEYRVNRPDTTSTTGAREDVNVTPLLSSVNVVTLDIDPTAGTVATAFSLPAGAWIVGATLHVSEAFVGGTSVLIGNDGDTDSLFSLTTPAIGYSLSAGADVNSILAAADDFDVTVTGTYTAGAAHLKVLWLTATKTTDDPQGAVGGSETVTTGIQDSLTSTASVPGFSDFPSI